MGLNAAGEVVNYAERALAITGQATLQGALTKLSGGSFKDGFTNGLSAGIAAGLANEITGSMQANIDARLELGTLSPVEASALRTLAQATGTAIRALANPRDPGFAMASDYLNSLLADGVQGLQNREIAANASQPTGGSGLTVSPGGSDGWNLQLGGAVTLPASSEDSRDRSITDMFQAEVPPITGDAQAVDDWRPRGSMRNVAFRDGPMGPPMDSDLHMGNGRITISPPVDRKVRISDSLSDLSAEELNARARAVLAAGDRMLRTPAGNEEMSASDLYRQGLGDIRETVSPAYAPAVAESVVSPEARALSKSEAFFTFNPAGQVLSGLGEGLLDLAASPVKLGNEAVLTTSDTIGHSVTGVVNWVTNSDMHYQSDSALYGSVERHGVFGTLGLGITGTVKGIVSPIDAMYRSDPEAFGRSIPGTALAVAPLFRSFGKVADGTVPYGFSNADEFTQFGTNMRSGLGGAGYPNAEPLLQGSAVTGKSFKTGQPFDLGRVSDFDVALADVDLLSKAQELGIGLRSGGTRTGPLTARDLRALGLRDLSIQMEQQVGREVNFMIYDNPATAAERAPSVTLPGGK